MIAKPKKFYKEKGLERINAKADGSFLAGVCAVYGFEDNPIVLIAPDMKTLERYWNKIANIPLTKEVCQEVAIFDKSKLERKS